MPVFSVPPLSVSGRWLHWTQGSGFCLTQIQPRTHLFTHLLIGSGVFLFPEPAGLWACRGAETQALLLRILIPSRGGHQGNGDAIAVLSGTCSMGLQGRWASKEKVIPLFRLCHWGGARWELNLVTVRGYVLARLEK